MSKVFEYKYKDGRDRSLHGAFSVRDTVRFEVHADAASVTMEIHPDCMPDMFILFENEGNGVFTRDIVMNKLCPCTDGGLFWYRYKIVYTDGRVEYCGGESPRMLLPCSEAGDRQLLLYRSDYTTPDFMKGCVIYHVFVDRFRKGGNYPLKEGAVSADWDSDIPEYGEHPGDKVKNNYFYGGDLDGICEKLPYIASLGTELIYLSPVFESPSNHRYDTADYMKVDKMLGGDGALEKLCRKAKSYGIGVMLDGVFNHTGDDSVYFNKYGRYDSVGAYQSADSPYFDWYNFRRFPDSYECWWGVDIMPRVDSENPTFRDFIMGDGGVIRKYMDMGVTGWRLDVCDELSDTFLDELRSTVKKENTDAVIIGEVWEDATNKTAYGIRRRYLRGSQLDCVMNYPFRDGVLSYVRYGDADKFKNITEGIFRRYPEQSVHCLMNMLSTHDTVRTITALAGDDGDGKCGSELREMRLTDTQREAGRRMAVFAFGIMCALPGAVSLFYGDETGIEGYRDPFCRRTYPWGNENTEMIDEFKRLGQLKKSCDVLRRGEFEMILADAEHLVISRILDNSQILCFFCRSGSYEVDIPEGYRVLYGKLGKLGSWDMVFLGN